MKNSFEVLVALIIIVLVVGILAAAAVPSLIEISQTVSNGGISPYAVDDGVANDWIFSVEPRENNTVSVWLRYDDTGVWCSSAPNIKSFVLQVAEETDPQVVIVYDSLNFGTPEYDLLGTAGCSRDGDNVTRYRIVGIRRAADDPESWIYPEYN